MIDDCKERQSLIRLICHARTLAPGVLRLRVFKDYILLRITPGDLSQGSLSFILHLSRAVDSSSSTLYISL